MALSRDYAGMAICLTIMLAGLSIGLFLPMLVVALIEGGGEGAIGDGILMLLIGCLTIPAGLIVGVILAVRFWKKRRSKRLIQIRTVPESS
jgi:hypothetical protein